MFKKIKEIIRNYMDKRANCRMLSLDWIEATSITNDRPKSNKRIVFVIPQISSGAGGLTSILRIGTYLSERGYHIVYAVVMSRFDEKQQIEQANGCLKNFGGSIVSFDSAEKTDFDVVIATDSLSVYYARKLRGYKMIFVQDYEPLFFATGDYSYIARKIYQMGFHMVSLGEWNKQMILTHVNNSLKIDTIKFPYERNEYTYIERDYKLLKNKKRLSMCVYIRSTPRRMPGLCQLISKHLTQRFAADGIKLNVFYYGEEKFKYEYGENLGKLNKEQLNQLYHDCDFGLVASGTNISLVPYEMMATGLPIIEFKDGSFPYFFDANDAFLFDLDYDKLYNEIKYSIEHPSVLTERDSRIQHKLNELSWSDTAEEFRKILEKLLV